MEFNDYSPNAINDALSQYFQERHYISGGFVYANIANDIEAFYKVAENIDKYGKEIALVESFIKDNNITEEQYLQLIADPENIEGFIESNSWASEIKAK